MEGEARDARFHPRDEDTPAHAAPPPEKARAPGGGAPAVPGEAARHFYSPVKNGLSLLPEGRQRLGEIPGLVERQPQGVGELDGLGERHVERLVDHLLRAANPQGAVVPYLLRRRHGLGHEVGERMRPVRQTDALGLLSVDAPAREDQLLRLAGRHDALKPHHAARSGKDAQAALRQAQGRLLRGEPDVAGPG